MSNYNANYTDEFKQQMVALVRTGRTPADLAREFPPSIKTLRKWARQADLGAGVRVDGTTTAEKDELKRLRKEVKRLRVERDILGKAAAWFARETKSIPSKDSNS